MTRISTLALAASMLALAGCSTVGDFGRDAMNTISNMASKASSNTESGTDPDTTSSAPSGRSQPQTPADQKLAEGISQYEKGNFAAAIRTLQSPEIADAGVATRVSASKYLAFSYCVTQRRTLCRRSFDAALQLDSAFELKPAEAGHPMWGPVYAQARKAATQRAERR